MRKLLSVFLLISLVVPFTGVYIYLEYQKKLVKKAVKEKMILGMDKKDLVLLKFHKDDINQLLDWEHSKEFGYNNQMYDVVYSQIELDSVSYVCWLDDEENEINLQIAELVKEEIDKNQANKKRKAQVFNFYKDIFFSISTIKIPIQLTQAAQYSISFEFNYHSQLNFPPSPPPETRLNG